MREIIDPTPLRLERSRYEVSEVFPRFEGRHKTHIKNLLKVVGEVNDGLIHHTSPGAFLNEVTETIKKLAHPYEEELGVRLTTFTVQQIALDFLYFKKGGGESDELPLSISLRSRLPNGCYESMYENVPNLLMQSVGTLPVTYSGDIRDLLAPVAVTIAPTDCGELRTFIEVGEVVYPSTKEHAVIRFSDHQIVTINDSPITLPDELIDVWFFIEEMEAGRKKKDQPKELIQAKQKARRLAIRVAETLARSISKKYNSASVGRLPFEKKDIFYDSSHSFLTSQRRFQERFYQSLGYHTLFHRVKTEYVTEL